MNCAVADNESKALWVLIPSVLNSNGSLAINAGLSPRAATIPTLVAVALLLNLLLLNQNVVILGLVVLVQQLTTVLYLSGRLLTNLHQKQRLVVMLAEAQPLGNNVNCQRSQTGIKKHLFY